MKCPSCKSDEAYVGALFVECPNKDCKFFSERQLNERLEASLKEMDRQMDEILSDPDKTPTYQWGRPLPGLFDD